MTPHVAVKRLVSGFGTRLLLRRLINFPRDTFDSLTGRRDPLIPPRGLWYVGGEDDYKAINDEFLNYFVQLAGVKPNYRMLDIGCGIGVVAARLARFLSSEGSYEGFDIVGTGIEWANANIQRRFPNFCFRHVDIFNKHYNPKGTLESDNFVFPYEAANFDFVFLKSVFTHMRPAGVQQYFREIRRVLKPSGCCLATVFLLNEESAGLIGSGQSSLDIRHDMGGYAVLDRRFPETAVALPERDFEQWYGLVGLARAGPVHYGSWCGRTSHLSYQDIIVLRPAEPQLSGIPLPLDQQPNIAR